MLVTVLEIPKIRLFEESMQPEKQILGFLGAVAVSRANPDKFYCILMRTLISKYLLKVSKWNRLIYEDKWTKPQAKLPLHFFLLQHLCHGSLSSPKLPYTTFPPLFPHTTLLPSALHHLKRGRHWIWVDLRGAGGRVERWGVEGICIH